MLALEPLVRLLRRERADLPGEPADHPAHLDRPAAPVGLPERHLARLARGGHDEDAVARDLRDPPARGPEDEDLARPALEDHLLVELADPPAAPLALEEDAVEPPVGDRAGVLHDEPLRALARLHDPAQAVPDEPRAQLRELVRGVAAGEHVEHALELGPGQGRVRGRPPDESVELVRPALPERDRGREVLREDVERVLRDPCLLDRALLHRSRDRGAREEVAAVLGEDDPARDRLHLVAGAADPLHPARDRDGRLDLDDEVDRPHVDPELERRRGDEGRQATRLERVLDEHALLAGDRAVVGAGDLLPRQLVEGGGEALREAAGVDEEEGRAVRADELEETGVDGRPDGAPVDDARRALGDLVRGGDDLLAEPRHVLDRHLDPQVEGLLRPGVDDRDRPRLPRPQALAPAEVAGHLLERPLRRREADPLKRPARRLLEPLEGESQVGPALRPHEGVDLVHDHGVDRSQELPRARREDEEERLGRRDEDVRGVAEHPRPLLGRRVAGADRDLRQVDALAAARGHARDARDRRAQVPLDVHREGLERRDVDDAAPVGLRRRRVEEQAVDRGEERGECLPRSRGREDEGALPPRDRGPAEPLRLRGGRERVGEPLADGGTERQLCRTGAHPPIIEDRPDTPGPIPRA